MRIVTQYPHLHGSGFLRVQQRALSSENEKLVTCVGSEAPCEILGKLDVRTTMPEIGLSEAKQRCYSVSMKKGQLALYSIARDQALRQLTQIIANVGQPDYLRARRSVVRLLQLSVNPTLALQSMATDSNINPVIVDQVISEGPPAKITEVAAHARRLARKGRKTVIWTIFAANIQDLEVMLADLNPVSIYSAVPSGEFDDLNTREGRLRRFHLDAECNLLLANPAAGEEGTSAHMICHEAIYLDRSYFVIHYLQAIDRIHRPLLEPGTAPNIHIYQTKAPTGLGSIDLSVSRRLTLKIRNLQEPLNDPNCRRLTLDEEDADDPIDLDVEMEDLVDLVEELEGMSPSSVEEE